MSVTVHVTEAARLEYLTEPTILAAGADHHADLATDARPRCREVVVLGRTGEQPGRFRGTTRVRRVGTTLLHQQFDLGDPDLDNTPAHLAGHRVVATELLIWGDDLPEPTGGDWWSLVPPAHGGSLATALAHDAITAERLLVTALATHLGLARMCPAPVLPVATGWTATRLVPAAS